MWVKINRNNLIGDIKTIATIEVIAAIETIMAKREITLERKNYELKTSNYQLKTMRFLGEAKKLLFKVVSQHLVKDYSITSVSKLSRY